MYPVMGRYGARGDYLTARAAAGASRVGLPFAAVEAVDLAAETVTFARGGEAGRA